MQRLETSTSARITGVHIVIGELTNHTVDSIRGAWEVLAKGTAGEAARLHFRQVPAEVQCMVCFEKYHPEQGRIRCPHCGSLGAKILAGEEFYMEALDVE